MFSLLFGTQTNLQSNSIQIINSSYGPTQNFEINESKILNSSSDDSNSDYIGIMEEQLFPDNQWLGRSYNDYNPINFGLPETNSGSSYSQIIALQFDLNTNISIDNAYIKFTSSSSQQGDLNILIFIEDKDDAINVIETANKNDRDISDRKWTLKTSNVNSNIFVNWPETNNNNTIPNDVLWRIDENWVTESKYDTEDISSLLNHIVSKSNWASGNKITLGFIGYGVNSNDVDRTAYMITNKPELHYKTITYLNDITPSQTFTNTNTVVSFDNTISSFIISTEMTFTSNSTGVIFEKGDANITGTVLYIHDNVLYFQVGYGGVDSGYIDKKYVLSQNLKIDDKYTEYDNIYLHISAENNNSMSIYFNNSKMTEQSIGLPYNESNSLMGSDDGGWGKVYNNFASATPWDSNYNTSSFTGTIKSGKIYENCNIK